jgi:hypothetical protein
MPQLDLGMGRHGREIDAPRSDARCSRLIDALVTHSFFGMEIRRSPKRSGD